MSNGNNCNTFRWAQLCNIAFKNDLCLSLSQIFISNLIFAYIRFLIVIRNRYRKSVVSNVSRFTDIYDSLHPSISFLARFLIHSLSLSRSAKSHLFNPSPKSEISLAPVRYNEGREKKPSELALHKVRIKSHELSRGSARSASAAGLTCS